MAEEIAFENGRISNFEGLVTLTLDRVVLHTVVHHSSTCQISLNSNKHFLDDGRLIYTDGHLRPALLGRVCRKVDLKMKRNQQKTDEHNKSGRCLCH